MKTSWDWLNEYVRLEVAPQEAAERLTMAGLNLEELLERDGDVVLDLEVTSNRPDCLGHIGVARELAVLFGQSLRIPNAEVSESDTPAETLTSVTIECPDLCPRYVARVIRGVRVGPSPDWMQRRLRAIGIEPINNVVDATNYVLMECGQPLHAFDFAKLAGQRIVVRRARAGEKILAINHREYELSPEMCVIADAERPVAIGGVMGGAETEITEQTRDVLIEVAEFAPLSIRNTARRLNLHSDSSFRFERGVDPCQLDWASRRCCELILATAGGELARDCVWAGEPPPQTPCRVRLRFAQVPRLLGIEVPPAECVQI
ncbi:MAG: phenylalanine--tRNA ligase subunit beta, partial [Planctomycetota bacterium]